MKKAANLSCFIHKKFSKQDYTKKRLLKEEYESCVFENCDFSGSNLTEIVFIDCTSSGCNLSLARPDLSVFRNVEFTHCKLTGCRFDNCSDFGFSVSFHKCKLEQASFQKISISKTVFKSCELIETDFTEADLTGSVFDDCDLTRFIFWFTNIEKCDFSSSYNFTIDPEKNKLKKARFHTNQLSGLLSNYEIEIL